MMPGDISLVEFQSWQRGVEISFRILPSDNDVLVDKDEVNMSGHYPFIMASHVGSTSAMLVHCQLVE
jgi:hypothetical protein